MPSGDTRASQHARIAALARVSREPSGSAMTQRARDVFRDSFYDKTDSALPHKDRQRQADAAYKLHMTRLSHRGALARARAKGNLAASAAAEARLAELQRDDEI